MSTPHSSVPSYIPRSVLFAPADILAIKISPDSTQLAIVKADSSGVMNLYVCPPHEFQNPASLKQITHFTTPEIYRFFWMDNSKHLVFLKDTAGSKTYQLYTVNSEDGTLINHTAPFQKTSAKIFKINGQKVAVGLNVRTPEYHDIYVLDVEDGTLIQTFENNGFSRFLFDEALTPVFKEKVSREGGLQIWKQNRLFMEFSPEDAFHSRLMTLEKDTLYFLDTRHSDTTVLKSLDLQTQKETTIAHDPKSDIEEIVFLKGRPVLYATTWLKKKWHSLGFKGLKEIQEKIGHSFEIISQSQDCWILRSTEPKRIGASFYLYNRVQNTLHPLYMAPTHPHLKDMIPFEFKARDGLELMGYLTLPDSPASLQDAKGPHPLIVLPHGGPFQRRDVWTYNPYHQWLASRGYGVLSLNFRLSSGLGKKLVNAGNGEWGRKAQHDILDGIDWCIQQGLTTKDQVGIMGASYGGYATLAGLAFTPKVFAVGIDIVGPSSLVTVMDKAPPYWDFPAYPLSDHELFFTRGAFLKSMGGSPDNREGRDFLESRSPLHYAHQIEAPLLMIHGDNDPIVRKEESQHLFTALQKLGQKTMLLSFPDEGHQFRRYANIDVYLAYAEKWLHDVLGGRFEPLDQKLLKESSLMKACPPVPFKEEGGEKKTSNK